MSSRHRKSRNSDRLRKSKLAFFSVGLLLANIFQWIALRNVEKLVVSFSSFLLALLGFYLGYKAKRTIKRHHGVIQGEGAALIGHWGNLALFILSFLLFLYLLLIGIYTGDLV